jgi:pyruvate,orthophosphate dikinase
MILAGSTAERIVALDELEPFIKEAAKGTLKVMDAKPLTFRLKRLKNALTLCTK